MVGSESRLFVCCMFVRGCAESACAALQVRGCGYYCHKWVTSPRELSLCTTRGPQSRRSHACVCWRVCMLCALLCATLSPFVPLHILLQSGVCPHVWVCAHRSSDLQKQDQALVDDLEEMGKPIWEGGSTTGAACSQPTKSRSWVSSSPG